MPPGVHIVALAARTAVGLVAEATAAAIRARISRVGEHPFLVDVNGERIVCGRDPRIAPELGGGARLSALVRPVLREIATKLPSVQSRVPFLLALPEPRPGFTPADAHATVAGLAGPEQTGFRHLEVRRVGQGHAGGLRGLNDAVDLLTRGGGKLCLVGGVDSYLSGETIDWLDGDRRLARGGTRGGFPPGEGGAIVALANEATRRELGLRSLAQVQAVACADETRDENAPSGPLGEALTDVYSRVTQELRKVRAQIDDVYCDINDERARTTDYAFALLRTGEAFRDGSQYTTSVGQVGDVGAATAPLNCVLATSAWVRSYANGRTALVSGSSWTGLRGAALLQEGKA